MLYGLEDKIEEFKKAVKENNLRQSYLFFGEPQIGKFTFAKSLVNFLENKEFAPPNGRRPLMDAEFFLPDESGSIGIDVVRRLKKFLYQRPVVSSRRSAVFDSAEALTAEAQNALLKIIEEPPQFSLIIFIAHETLVFSPTLTSRFTKVYFPRLSQKSIEKFLKEKLKVSPEKAVLTAKQSFGRIGRAVQLTQSLPSLPTRGLPKGDKTEKADPESLSVYLEELILSLHKNLLKNSSKLSWLLEREELIKRYNVNPKLQYKAIQEKLYE
jgi:DNA polymerase-3 subunit delta'